MKKHATGKTKQTKERVIAAIHRRKGTLYLAAADLGVTCQTLRNYARRWKEVPDAIAEAKGRVLDLAEGMLFKAIKAREPWAICFFLKTQGKDRGYTQRSEHRVGGDPKAPPIGVGSALVSIDSLDLPIETQRQILDALRRAKEKQVNGKSRGMEPAPPR